MRIVHYYASGQVRCGLIDADGKVRDFAELSDTLGHDPRTIFNRLLQMTPAERDEVESRLLQSNRVAVEMPQQLAPAVPDPPWRHVPTSSCFLPCIMAG